ncbi:MAG: hypothetical protein AAGM21_12110 [Pseudomonadota bacterium]
MGLRSLLSPVLVLCLLIALPMTGWAQGGMARAVDAIVVCKTHGPDVILLDWHGQPVEVLPTCPDCALVAGPVPVASGQVPGPDGVVLALSAPHRLVLAPALGGDRSLWPRAPPV